jgi:hypothetical protein
MIGKGGCCRPHVSLILMHIITGDDKPESVADDIDDDTEVG